MSTANAAGPDGCGADRAAARGVFGDRFELARRYAGLLATDGLQRGLMGPREVDRLWDRHLLNCAVVTELLPVGARVVDVGSGAGLPGIPMAIRRDDLRVDLVDPMLRRTQFLTEAVTALGLPGVRVVRGRADDRRTAEQVGGTDWVVARAVAPLDRLVKWCLPLLAPGGRLLALKGERARAEVAAHEGELRRSGAAVAAVRQVGAEWLALPTWVVVVERIVPGRPARAKRGSA